MKKYDFYCNNFLFLPTILYYSAVVSTKPGRPLKLLEV